MSKFTGWLPTPPKERDSFDTLLGQTQGSPLFGDLFADTLDDGKGKVSTPYKSVMKFFAGAFGDENQTTGDCTSHGTRNAFDISRAVEIDIKGEPEEWVARGATEPIYGMRGHSGQGMNVTRAARLVHDRGFFVRKRYEGGYDLSRYNSDLGTNWGSRGTPSALLEQGRPMRYLASISLNNAANEIRTAVANGYGIVFGGKGGWSSRRDGNGIALGIGSASWNHCMSIGAYDDRCVLNREPLGLVLQSWAGWNAGGHPDFGPIPVGSALIPISYLIETYVRRGEMWVVGEADGFPAKKLPSYGFEGWL